MPDGVLAKDSLRRPRTIEVEWVRAVFVRQPPWGNGETAEKGELRTLSRDTLFGQGGVGAVTTGIGLHRSP